MTILVTGGREFSDWETVRRVLGGLHAHNPITKVVEGGATGADALARLWAHRNGITFKSYHANWLVHGDSAGPRRNKEMIREARPSLVVAFSGGAGTRDCIRQAEKAGLVVIKV